MKTVSKEKSANMSNTDGLTGFTSMPQFLKSRGLSAEDKWLLTITNFYFL